MFNSPPIPTAEMIEACKALLLARVYTKTIRPGIEAIQKKNLDILRPQNECDSGVITDIAKAWQMPEADFIIFVRDCHEDYLKAGFKVPHCGISPLLVAEELERQAARTLVEITAPMHKLNVNDVLCAGLKLYHELIELNVEYIMPFVKLEGVEINRKPTA